MRMPQRPASCCVHKTAASNNPAPPPPAGTPALQARPPGTPALQVLTPAGGDAGATTLPSHSLSTSGEGRGEANSTPEGADRITLPDGAVVRIRPVALADEARLRRMFYRLSPASIHTWMFVPAPKLPERAAVLAGLARVDYERQYALVASAGNEIVGIARYDLEVAQDEAELGIIIEDAWQARGLGKLLMRRLIVEASQHRITAFTARILGENRRALRLIAALFATVQWEWHSGECQAHTRLEAFKPAV